MSEEGEPADEQIFNQFFDCETVKMAQQFTIDPPSAFDFHAPSEWTKWIRRFERFRIASGLKNQDESEQINMLIYTMGDKADDIFLSFKLSDSDSKKYDTVTSRFNSHFVPKVNVIFERSKFNTRVQEVGESVEEFITALHKLSVTCDYDKFGNGMQEELIRDRLVIGLLDKKVNQKLQLEDKLTLERAIQVARQCEDIKNQNDPNSVSRVQFQRGTGRRTQQMEKKDQRGSSDSKISESRAFKCYWCSSNVHHIRSQCPALKANCSNCSRIGHYEKACLKKNVNAVSIAETPCENENATPGPGETFFINSIDTATQETSWSRTIRINNCDSIRFKIDTGADVTVLPHEMAARYKIRPSEAVLIGPSKAPLDFVGVFDATLSYKNTSSTQRIYVVRNLHEPLLGKPAINGLNIIKFINETVMHTGVHSEVQPYTEFPKLWSGLGNIPGEYKITLDKDHVPFAITAPRKIPIPLRKKVEEELNRMQSLGIIRAVEEPTDYCAPMTCVYKKNGKIRICVDLTRLNKSVKREWHPIPSVENTLALITGAQIFTKLDANSGFWQIPLAEESKHLTTFITPFGRYAFNRLPFGITSAPEVFSRIVQKLLHGLDGTVCHMDDILIFGSTREEHNRRLRAVLEVLQASGMTLNKEKSVFAVDKITFLGHNISKEGISIDPERIKAITEMPEPTNVTELLRFLGMINFVCRSIPNRSTVCEALNHLLKKDIEWTWDHAQRDAFQKVKDLVTKSPVLAIFDPTKTTTISSDSSSYGLGACLLQKQENGDNRPIAYISRTLTQTERRYANIEREALGVAWACAKLSDYILGIPIFIETDHKPLVTIFNAKHLDELTPRLQRLKLAMLRYNYVVFYTPGKLLYTADTLSRSPLSDCGSESEEFSEELTCFVQSVINYLPISDVTLAALFQKQQYDDSCISIRSFIHGDWPAKERLSTELQKFWVYKDEIACVNGLLLFRNRLIIPAEMRGSMLNRLHEGHFGVSKCRQRANDTVWWPAISTDINDMVKRCPNCIQERINLREPLIPTKLPSRPWQKICLDLFKIHNKWYVVLIDYYSKFIEMEELSSLKSAAVITFMKRTFSRHGIPEEVYSDNGPQFQKVLNSEFATFARDYGFRHTTSSPRYAQSNGMAEAAVKIAKSRLKKGGDIYKAILSYHSIKLPCGFSPAELLFGRKLRTTVPIIRDSLQPQKIPHAEIARRDEMFKNGQKKNFDRRHNARELSPLTTGQNVWITDKREYGRIIEKSEYPRSYIIATNNGNLRRNRFHLIPAHDIKAEETFDPDPITIPNTLSLNESEKNHQLTEQLSLTESNHPNIPIENAEAALQATDEPAVKTTRSGRVVKPRIILDL